MICGQSVYPVASPLQRQGRLLLGVVATTSGIWSQLPLSPGDVELTLVTLIRWCRICYGYCFHPHTLIPMSPLQILLVEPATEFAYLDSGAPGSESYTTVFVVHGIAWTSGRPSF